MIIRNMPPYRHWKPISHNVRHASCVLRLWFGPILATFFKLFIGHLKGHRALIDIDVDDVAFFYERDRTARIRFRLTWPIAGPFVAPEKRPSVMSATS